MRQQIDEVNCAEYLNKENTEAYEYWYQVIKLENTKTKKKPELTTSEKWKANKVDGENTQATGF